MAHHERVILNIVYLPLCLLVLLRKVPSDHIPSCRDGVTISRKYFSQLNAVYVESFTFMCDEALISETQNRCDLGAKGGFVVS